MVHELAIRFGFIAILMTAVEAGPDVRQLPILWCAVRGSPTADRPGEVGDLDGETGASLSTVLWRRHERVTDRIYAPVANIAFRSALDTLKIRDVFPIIEDLDTSSGDPGDVDIGPGGEVRATVTACEDAWIDLLRNHDRCESDGFCTVTGGSCTTDASCPGFQEASLPGVPVINVNRLTGLTAGIAEPIANCDNDFNSNLAWTPNGGYAMVEDRMYSGTDDNDARLLGHELGHVLGLWHTSDPDNLMFEGPLSDSQFSQDIEDAVDWTGVPSCFSEGVVPRPNINQIEWVQQEALDWPTNPLDPPMALIPGPTQSFIQLDQLGDVSEPAVDLSGLRVTESSSASTTTFTHRLVGSLADGLQGTEALNYWVFVDMDNNESTGGGSSDLPLDAPDSGFTGIEMITRVTVLPDLSTTFDRWFFVDGSFELRSGEEFISSSRGQSFRSPGHGPVSTTFEFVSITQLSLLDSLANPFRLQACAENPTTGTVDCMNDSTGSTGGGALYSLEDSTPYFPICGVTPAEVSPGQIVTVDVAGFGPNEPLHAILGDQSVAAGFTDNNGASTISFPIPTDSAGGLRLVTVGVDETALTADCFAQISEEDVLPITLAPQVSRSDQGDYNRVTATVRVGNEPVQDVTVSFSIISGPNAGTDGICDDAICRTNISGRVSFFYQGDGGSGIDQIVASFVDVDGKTVVTSNVAVVFWDQDCLAEETKKSSKSKGKSKKEPASRNIRRSLKTKGRRHLK